MITTNVPSAPAEAWTGNCRNDRSSPSVYPPVNRLPPRQFPCRRAETQLHFRGGDRDWEFSTRACLKPVLTRNIQGVSRQQRNCSLPRSKNNNNKTPLQNERNFSLTGSFQSPASTRSFQSPPASMLSWSVVVVVAFVASSHAYRNGAPMLRMDMMMNSMCTIGNLRPNHRENNRQIMPQFGPAPFQLRVEQPHFPYAPGRKVKGEYCSASRAAPLPLCAREESQR